MNADEIFKKASEEFVKERQTNPFYRWGQACWNTAEDFVKTKGSQKLKNAFEELRGSDADCFYNDDLTQRFYEALKVLEGEKMKNKKVYISGPITCNKEHYKEEFEKAKKFLESKGYEVINPAEDDYTEEVKKAGIEDIWSQEAWLWYIKRDIDIVSKCDAIYMLLNFEKSHGAIVEKATAERAGLDIWYEAEKEKVPECE